MPDDRSFQVLEAVPSRLEVSSERPRRRWSVEAKMALIEETLKPDANVSAIARQAEISPAQLFGWRCRLVSSNPMLLSSGSDLSKSRGHPPSMIEIVVADVVVRVGADVDPDYLTKVIRAVRQA